LCVASLDDKLKHVGHLVRFFQACAVANVDDKPYVGRERRKRDSLNLSHSLNFTYDSSGFVQSRGANKMSDRKYRQRGYMDSDREPQRSKPQSKTQDREGPRSPRMMGFSEALKCAACGAKAQPNINVDSSCPNCKADLHTCRQCTYFDPGARFECSKPIATRIMNKNARNTCELFEARIVIERETSSGPPTDARQAFAKLFKK
jgi:hypothetical protein